MAERRTPGATHPVVIAMLQMVSETLMHRFENRIGNIPDSKDFYRLSPQKGNAAKNFLQSHVADFVRNLRSRTIRLHQVSHETCYSIRENASQSCLNGDSLSCNRTNLVNSVNRSEFNINASDKRCVEFEGFVHCSHCRAIQPMGWVGYGLTTRI